METDELEAIMSGESLFEFRSKRAFKKLDLDGSGEIDKKEIFAFMKESTEGDISEEELMKDIKKWQNAVVHDDIRFTIEDFKLIFRELVKSELGVKI